MLVASGLIVKIISVKKHWNYAILCLSLQKLQLFPSTGSNVWVFNVVPCRNCNCSLLQDQMIGFFMSFPAETATVPFYRIKWLVFYVVPCRNCNCSLLQDQMIGFFWEAMQNCEKKMLLASSCLSACPLAITRLLPEDFHEVTLLWFF